MYDNSSFWKTKRRSENEKREANDGLKLFILDRTKRRFENVMSSWCGFHYSLFQVVGENRPIRRHFGAQFVSFTERNGYHYKEKLAFSILPTLFWPFPMSYVAFPWSVSCLVGESIAHFPVILR